MSDVGPVHKAPPPVATQLVVPTELNDGPVDLTCVHCQHHVRTNTKSGPSFLAWALCCCMCLVGVWVSLTPTLYFYGITSSSTYLLLLCMICIMYIYSSKSTAEGYEIFHFSQNIFQMHFLRLSWAINNKRKLQFFINFLWADTPLLGKDNDFSE